MGCAALSLVMKGFHRVVVFDTRCRRLAKVLLVYENRVLENVTVEVYCSSRIITGSPSTTRAFSEIQAGIPKPRRQKEGVLLAPGKGMLHPLCLAQHNRAARTLTL